MSAAGPRVAVVGSCVTRDTWSLAGPPESRPLRYFDRTSLASLTMAAGCENPLAPLAAGLNNQHRHLRAELAKDTLAQLGACQPDLLVLDFIDERFDLLACGAGVANESLELLQSGLLHHPLMAGARRIDRLGEEAWQHWEAGLLRLRQGWQGAGLGACRILLHACLWADEIETPAGRQPLPDACQILPARVTSRAAHNALLRRMHARFAEVFPAATLVAPPPALRVADAAHRWGPAPFHFVRPYYQSLAAQAAAAGLPLWAAP